MSGGLGRRLDVRGGRVPLRRRYAALGRDSSRLEAKLAATSAIASDGALSISPFKEWLAPTRDGRVISHAIVLMLVRHHSKRDLRASA